MLGWKVGTVSGRLTRGPPPVARSAGPPGRPGRRGRRGGGPRRGRRQGGRPAVDQRESAVGGRRPGRRFPNRPLPRPRSDSDVSDANQTARGRPGAGRRPDDRRRRAVAGRRPGPAGQVRRRRGPSSTTTPCASREAAADAVGVQVHPGREAADHGRPAEGPGPRRPGRVDVLRVAGAGRREDGEDQPAHGVQAAARRRGGADDANNKRRRTRPRPWPRRRPPGPRLSNGSGPPCSTSSSGADAAIAERKAEAERSRRLADRAGRQGPRPGRSRPADRDAAVEQERAPAEKARKEAARARAEAASQAASDKIRQKELEAMKAKYEDDDPPAPGGAEGQVGRPADEGRPEQEAGAAGVGRRPVRLDRQDAGPGRRDHGPGRVEAHRRQTGGRQALARRCRTRRSLPRLGQTDRSESGPAKTVIEARDLIRSKIDLPEAAPPSGPGTTSRTRPSSG